MLNLKGKVRVAPGWIDPCVVMWGATGRRRRASARSPASGALRTRQLRVAEASPKEGAFRAESRAPVYF